MTVENAAKIAPHDSEWSQRRGGYANSVQSLRIVGRYSGGRALTDHDRVDQAGVNIGTGGPLSVGLKTTFTRWPIRIASRSQSTMLVIIVTPSSSVT